MDDDKYEGLNVNFVYFITILRNSLGDLAAPTFEIWF
jgi:hypothetical protein